MSSFVVNLFNSGVDGYHTYRIPSLLLSPDGTLLAFCEGRRNSRDDHGQTWQAGAAIQPGGDECQVVELEDGGLLMNMRMENRSEGYRALARSGDGAETWSKPIYDENLPCPVCPASFVRAGSRLLFSNPVPPGPATFERGDRVNLTVRASEDEGRSWPVARLLHKGPSAYSCLCALPGGDIGCLFEGGEKMCYEQIIFARFLL